MPGLIIRPDFWNGIDTTYSPDYVIVEMVDSAGMMQIDTIGIETITSTLINLYWENVPDTVFIKHHKSFHNLPLYLSSPYKAALYQSLTDKSIYILVNSSSNKGIDLKEFAKTLKDELDSEVYENIIYDIRLNSGGSYNLSRKIEDLIINEIAESAGNLYLITGNLTGSAAINTAASLKHHLGEHMTIAGEPIGDNLIFWAEPKIFRLPNSGLRISAPIYQHDLKNDRFIPFKTNWGNLFWSFASGGIDVDVPVEVSITDYINYEDPVMAWVLELIEKENDR